jgi:hypothetical protein
MNASSLRDAQREKKDKQKEIYKLILNECYKRIKLANEQTTKTIFTIPWFMMGSPLYDMKTATRYVIKKLKKGQFDVKTQDNKLFIDWSSA